MLPWYGCVSLYYVNYHCLNHTNGSPVRIGSGSVLTPVFRSDYRMYAVFGAH